MFSHHHTKMVMRVLLDGLFALEYRGYDSAGIAVATKHDGEVISIRAVGRVSNLRNEALKHKIYEEIHKKDDDYSNDYSVDGASKYCCGVGHTRWATHGAPTLHNTHPITFGDVVIVHNGVIDNYVELRNYLVNSGHIFTGETDTEIIAVLLNNAIASELNNIIINNHKHIALDKALKLSGLDNVKNVDDIRILINSISYIIRDVINKLNGMFSFLAIISAPHQANSINNINNAIHGKHKFMIAVNRGLPMLFGTTNDKSVYIASDQIAISSYCDSISYLENGDILVIYEDPSTSIINNVCYANDGTIVIRDTVNVQIEDLCINRSLSKLASDREVIGAYGAEDRSVHVVHEDLSTGATPQFSAEVEFRKRSNDNSRNPHHCHMLSEIFEQPQLLIKFLSSKTLNHSTSCNANNTYDHLLSKVCDIHIIACGSSFYAAYIGQYIIELFSDKRVIIDIASEFNGKSLKIHRSTAFIFISQSGETADVIAALTKIQNWQTEQLTNHPHQSYKSNASNTSITIGTIGIVNRKNSHIARNVQHLIHADVGNEIAVASTKSFTVQIAALIMITKNLINLQCKNDDVQPCHDASLINLEYIANEMNLLHMVLQQNDCIENIARTILKHSRYIIYIGRGISYPIALEGALKMQELAYIPSYAVAAGELKHGPLAMIDEKTPVIAIAPSCDHLFAKTLSNIIEIRARKGIIILCSDAKGILAAHGQYDYCIELPIFNWITSPIAYALPMQLIACYTALALNRDVDRPRNLAKSVTVE